MTDAPVVMLIHGIRTPGDWQSRIASLIEKETGATVIPIKYGYFDVLRFLCPFGFCSSGPIEMLRQQVEGVANSYRERPLIVFAHSYGTYALTRVIDQNPYFRFDRVILCGSVVPRSFDWRKVEEQIKGPEKRNAIINECGRRDIWPVLAESATFGDYGATGTEGFGTFNVRDRFHDLTHSDFLTNEFADKYWIPLVRGDAVTFSAEDIEPTGSPGWFKLLKLPLKWVLPAAVAAAIVLSSLMSCEIGQRIRTQCYSVREELRGHVDDLRKEVRKTLNVKDDVDHDDDLFGQMDSYTSAPSPEKWELVMKTTKDLLEKINEGLKIITQSKASFDISDGKTYYKTKDAKILVKPELLESFKDIRSHFTGRTTIVSEMQGAGDLPDAEKVDDWKVRLEDLHHKLDSALGKLIDLLERM